MSGPLKPICVNCRCFYRPEKNGYMFMEGMPIDNDPFMNIRGNRAPNAWQPYKLWRGDLWECPDCQHQIVVGVAQSPMAEHYELNFSQIVEAYPPEIQVNDC